MKIFKAFLSVCLTAICLLPAACSGGSGSGGDGGKEPEAPATLESFNDGKIVKSRLEFSDDGILQLPTIFQDGMVIQRDRPVQIWGVGKANARLTCRLIDDTENVVSEVTGTIPDDSTFIFSLDAQSGSMRNYKLQMESDERTLEIKNVQFGDVYLSCGQSNMEYVLSDVEPTEKKEIVADAKALGNLKIYKMDRLSASTPNANSNFPTKPQFDMNGGRWIASTSSMISSCSAIGIVFTTAMAKAAENKYPVALINAALGGTVVESWVSREAIDNNIEYFRSVYLKQSEFNKWGDNNYNQMTAMYNSKIASIKYFQCLGAIWYQGESNLAFGFGAENYVGAMKVLIEEWEQNFGIEKFIMTSLASFYYGGSVKHDGVPVYNDAMRRVTELKENTAVIPIYDISNEYGVQGGIHPYHKLEIGKRLVSAYNGEKFPAYESAEIDGNSITVTFKDVNGQLKIKNGVDLKGFSVAGSDGVFKTATATITDTNKVRLTCDSIAHPKYCAYAFTTFTEQANLCDSKGHPALQFTNSEASVSTYPEGLGYLDCDSMTAWIADKNNNQKGKYGNIFEATGGTMELDNELFSEGTGSIHLTETTQEVSLKILSRAYGELDLSDYAQVCVDVKCPSETTVKLLAGTREIAATTVAEAQNGFSTFIFDVASMKSQVAYLQLVFSTSDGAEINIDNIRLL